MKNNYSNLFEKSSDFGNNMGRLFFETPCVSKLNENNKAAHNILEIAE